MNSPKLTLAQRRSIAEVRRTSKATLWSMLFVGLVISGMIEMTAFPVYTTEPGPVALLTILDLNETRRYCDPPNMTIIYDDYEIIEDSREWGEEETTEFKVELNLVDAVSQWRWQVFLWGSIIGPAPASWLALHFGPGPVIGISVLVAGLLGIFVPSMGLIVPPYLTFLQGIIHGGIIPCALLLGISVSQEERTSYLALLAGSKLGYTVGELFPSHLLPFTTCISAVTWFATWVLIIESPRLTTAKLSVPWKEILSSRVLWMAVLVVFGAEFTFTVISYVLREYFRYVYGLTNHYLLMMPFVFLFIFALVCGKVGISIESSGLVSKTTSRRIFVFISHFIPAGILFVTGFVGCDEVAPISLYAVAILSFGAFYSGAAPSILDVSVNFAAVVVPLICICGAVARLIPVLLTFLTLNGLMPGSWRLLFSITSVVALATSMIFMLRGSSHRQPWDGPEVTCTQPSNDTRSSSSHLITIRGVPHSQQEPIV